MGWSIGYDEQHQRDIGYGVPAYCDHPGCNAEIDRGLGYICANEEPGGGDEGCGLFFCDEHGGGNRCECCTHARPPFKPKPDHPKWIQHQLTDPSWAKWRRANSSLVAKMRASLQEGSESNG